MDLNSPKRYLAHQGKMHMVWFQKLVLTGRLRLDFKQTP